MEQEGVWRTVGGRKVFIKNGQSLEDAMRESGKFDKGTNMGKTTLKGTLSEDDIKLLDDAVMDAGMMEMNYVLREGIDNIPEQLKKDIKDLDTLIKKSEINKDVELYRYISDEEVFKHLKDGDIYEDKSFMSTTYDPKSDRESSYDYNVKMVIQAPKGSKALDVSSIYDKQAKEGREEREVMFGIGTKLKLTGKDTLHEGGLASEMKKKVVTEKEAREYSIRTQHVERYIYYFEIEK